MRHSETNINNRIEVIDALRGFALLGIFLRHFISRFDYKGGQYFSNQLFPQVDKWIEAADHYFLIDKTYPIFALLFGFSMCIVNQSANSSSSWRSYKRLLGLVPFACLNAIFFPAGDILGLYIVVGFVVLLLVKLPLKWMPYLSVFFLLQPLVWIQIVINLFNGNLHIINYNSSSFINDVDAAIAGGNILEIIWTNLTKGEIGNIVWALEVGRISQTIGLMLLGYYLYGSGQYILLIEKAKRNLRYLIIPIVIIAAGMAVKKLMIATPVSKELNLIISNWTGMSFAGIYVILIVFLHSIIPSRYFSPLHFFGRMSLTNYVSQSIVGGILFAPFALNGIAYLSTTSIVLLFILFTIVQMLFSKYWFIQNRYGPLELYWRRMSLYAFK